MLFVKTFARNTTAPEIVDTDTLSQYLNAIAQNEPDITPLLGGSIQAAVIHDNEALFDPIIDIGYQGQGYSIGFWVTTGDDAYVVKNWYADERAQKLDRLGSYGHEQRLVCKRP